MTGKGFITGVVLLIAVNAFVLAGAAWNRSGKPDAEAMLTERELALQRIDKENSGISLRLIWQDDSRDWFNAAKLAEFGFDCSFPIENEESRLFYRKALPRKGYLVLEYEGQAWEKWLADKRAAVEKRQREHSMGKVRKEALEEARRELAWAQVSASRLFAVDAGKDPQVLRERYPDRGRHLILPAEVRLYYRPAVKEKDKIKEPAQISGDIQNLLTDTVTVPKGKRALLEKLALEGNWSLAWYNYYAKEPPRQPRYKVVLRWGKRYEPWVVSVLLP